MKDHLRMHALISGRVQGVGFRHWSVKTATSFNLTGWVKNLENGSVELVAEGPKDLIDKMKELLYLGPRFSKVENVEIKESAALGEFSRFSLVRDE